MVILKFTIKFTMLAVSKNLSKKNYLKIYQLHQKLPENLLALKIYYNIYNSFFNVYRIHINL